MNPAACGMYAGCSTPEEVWEAPEHGGPICTLLAAPQEDFHPPHHRAPHTPPVTGKQWTPSQVRHPALRSVSKRGCWCTKEWKTASSHSENCFSFQKCSHREGEQLSVQLLQCKLFSLKKQNGILWFSSNYLPEFCSVLLKDFSLDYLQLGEDASWVFVYSNKKTHVCIKS